MQVNLVGAQYDKRELTLLSAMVHPTWVRKH